ncbi:ComEC/Rec2 family competence protein [Ancylomarina longa]|uniref:ComEC family competence protein n=1 Tax=Ancylomarina longa TaxID=2487017 RepID=A0A434ATN9_9BACT|nr:ComEC/Rec2 family competence protein [Ancylomarina longa]RUT77789.1 ComEC family competence protein [Ancylomarina longa]
MSFRELIRQYPFIRLLLPLTIGIFLANALDIQEDYLFIAIFISILGILLFKSTPFMRKSPSLRVLFGAFVFLLFVAVGSYRIKVQTASMKLNSADTNTYYIGKLLENPIARNNSYKCSFEISAAHITKSWRKESVKVLLYFKKDSSVNNLLAGSQLLIHTRLQRVRNAGNPNEFDYAAYLKTQHTLYSAFLPPSKWQAINVPRKFSITDFAWKWRAKLLGIYKQNGITGNSFDILAALSLGAKSDMDPEIKQAWTNAGVMHVLAVSGLHVGIIYVLIHALFSSLLRYRWGNLVRGILLIILIWMYAILTGLSPSVMRATCMFSFIIVGEILKRRGGVFNSLAASAFFLLLIDPYLIFTVGFQFSYLAVAGIVFFQPRFNQLFYVNNFMLRWFWKLTTLSISAQIATAPLAIYYFHQFPSYFLLSGYIVIPMAAILIYLSVALLFLSPFNYLSHQVGNLIQYLIDFLNWFVLKIQHLPSSIINDLFLSNYELILIYLLLFSLIFILVLKRKTALFLFLIILIAFSFPNLIQKFKKSQKELIVFNAGNHSLIGLSYGKQAIFFKDENLSESNFVRITKPYLQNKRIQNYQINTLSPMEFFVFGKQRIAVIEKSKTNQAQALDSLKPDFVIIRRRGTNKINDLITNSNHMRYIYEFKLARNKINSIDSIAKGRQADIFFVKNSGAYLYNISTQN